MPMTKAQQEYAIQRISSIYHQNIQKIKEDHATPAVKLTTEDRWDLVQAGKVSLKKDYQPSSWTDWHNLFDFSTFEHPERISDEGQKLIDAENQRFQNAKDQIMLGDAMEAMNIVSNY